MMVMYMLYLLRALALTQTLGVPVRFLCVFFCVFAPRCIFTPRRYAVLRSAVELREVNAASAEAAEAVVAEAVVAEAAAAEAAAAEAASHGDY